MADIFVSYASQDRDVAFRIVGFLDHPQSPAWEVTTRIKAIKDGFEFQPVDAAPDDKNIARFSIVDDSTMKLVRADGQPQDGPIRVRCPGK